MIPLRKSTAAAFTLIELSIVLVIIGLIVGGVLVGRDLITSATVRAQISQIEKYNTAVNTFYGKYGGLPGDLAARMAAQNGFVTRSGAAGRGDGNGYLEGFDGSTPYLCNEDGESLIFWEDLSTTRLIDGSFTTYVDGAEPSCTLTSCAQYFPQAKLGGGNSVYVYSGYAAGCCSVYTGVGPNFFGLGVTAIGGSANIGAGYGGVSNPGTTVAQAYAMDKKMDDGMPQSGKVMAQSLNNYGGVPAWSTNGASGTVSTCFDTSSGATAYSISQNNGTGVNCSMSFQFQ